MTDALQLDQPFTDQGIRGTDWPTKLEFGLDDWATWCMVRHRALRDFGQSDPKTRFCLATKLDGSPNPSFPGCLADGTAPLVQIP